MIRKRLGILMNCSIPLLAAAGIAAMSSGGATGLANRCDAVACGSLLYAPAPVVDDLADLSGFQPALGAIRTRLYHVSNRAAGRPPGSDADYLRHGVSVTGTIPLGLNEAYRGPSPGRVAATMLLRGRRVPVLRVCLENTVLDLSAIAGPQPGEDVVAQGRDGEDEITLEDMAECQAISPLSVLMSFDRHLPCRYFGGASA